jgi:hypothetical protein
MALARLRITERQALMLIMAASLVAYAGAFFLASIRKRGQPVEVRSQARVRWMPEQPQSARPDYHYVIADMFDPSLMSLPSGHGFSAPLWARTAAATQRPIEPVREQAFLDASASPELPPLLRQAAMTDLVQSATEKLVAAPDPVELDPVEPAVAPSKSVLHINGSLEQRPVVQPANLPVVSSATPLRPTRVRLAVAPDGTVRYAVLDRSCGNESVDAKALEAVGQMRFEPKSSVDPLALSWGTAGFFWATAPD